MSERDRKKELAFEISRDMQAEDIRQAAVHYAECHSRWYDVQSNRMGEQWNYLTLAIVVLSALSSVTAAYDLGPTYRFIPAGLAAIAAFCAAFLTQFRVRDLWQIREAGRISAEKLVAKAQLIDSEDNKKAFAEAIALRLDLHELEIDQTHQFFAVPKIQPAAAPR